MLQITYFFNKLKFYSMVAAAAVSSSDATAAAFMLLLFVVSLFKLENEIKGAWRCHAAANANVSRVRF